MRILLVADAGSIHTRRWAQYFRECGHDVHIASFRPYNIEGMRLHILPTFMLGKLGYFLGVITLKRLYKAIKPDIVHAHYITSYGLISVLAGIKPLVVTAWGSDVLLSPKESFILRLFARFTLKKADVVTTVAEHMNSAVMDLDIGIKKIQAIPFGVDTDLFRINSSVQKEKGVIRLICTRNFSPIYDISTLIKAIAILKRNSIPLKAMLVGDGPLKGELVSMVTSLNLQDDITFLGHVGHERLSECLAESDIFVTPALSDGNNVSLTEAMACGCFPIATSIPANTQWITNGYNGYLYPVGNAEALAYAIEEALKNRALMNSARLLNRKIIEERADWKKCVKKMECIYINLIKN